MGQSSCKAPTMPIHASCEGLLCCNYGSNQCRSGQGSRARRGVDTSTGKHSIRVVSKGSKKRGVDSADVLPKISRVFNDRLRPQIAAVLANNQSIRARVQSRRVADDAKRQYYEDGAR